MSNLSETARLAKLFEYQILDTAPERDFDEITAAAARLLNTPISAVSLIDKDRQWFKARYGLQGTQTPRDQAFCAHAIEGEEMYVVPDATQDPKFAKNPLVTGNPNIRFYAGVPLVTPDNFKLGTLCVIDTTPRSAPTEDERTILTLLARLVMRELENRRIARRAEHQANMMARLADSVVAVAQAQTPADIARVAADAARRLCLADAVCVIQADQTLAPDARMTVAGREGSTTPITVPWQAIHAPLIARSSLLPATTLEGDVVPSGGAWMGFRLGVERRPAVGTLQIWRRMTSSYTELEAAVLSDLVRVTSAVMDRAVGAVNRTA